MEFSYWQPPPSTGRAALRWGLTFGLLHGIVSSLLTALAATILSRFSGQLTLFSIPTACTFFLLAGFFAARKAGKVGSGTLAGLEAGFISRILSAILVVNLNIFYLLPRDPQTGVQAVSVSRLEPLFVLELLYLVLDLGLGISFGALGGLPGKSVSKVSSPRSTYMTQEQLSAPFSMPEPTIRQERPSTPLSMPQAATQQQSSAPLSMPQLPKVVERSDDDDPAPYGTPFFPPPYPVPPTQSPPQSR